MKSKGKMANIQNDDNKNVHNTNVDEQAAGQISGKPLSDLESGHFYYMNENKPAEAIKYYQKFVEDNPQHIQAKICLALSYLKTKNFEDGWRLFENRLDNEINQANAKSNDLVLEFEWNKEKIKDKTIFIYAERGLGDTIMFSRFLQILKEKCAKVLFMPHEPCFELLKQNNPQIEVINQLEDHFDYHAPLMSLPYKLGMKDEKDIPFRAKYLNADTEKINCYKQKYFLNEKFKIGINWQGNIQDENKRQISIENFYKLFEMENVEFYSLQTGEPLALLENFKYKITDLGSTFKDFSDTAAAIENLDLVISNDTSVAHLAGALGKKCWILLPYIQDWRWSEDISYCPWYQSVRLFKQNHLCEWGSVFENVCLELEKII